MDLNRLVLYIAGLIILIGIERFVLKKVRINWKTKRHNTNIKNAKKVILKLSAFDGDYADARILSYLKKINPYVFEELLLEAFEGKGYRIIRNKSYSGDGGLDGIIVNQNNEKVLIQAKRYKGAISGRHLETFKALVLKKGAKGGYFIHTGKTPKSLKMVSEGVSIISGNRLTSLIKSTIDLSKT